jgi:hypothetical protein
LIAPNIKKADNSHHLLLKTILQESVCELGLQKNGDKGTSGRPERDLAVYRETFETRFLKETTQYYQAESSSFIERLEDSYEYSPNWEALRKFLNLILQPLTGRLSRQD